MAFIERGATPIPRKRTMKQHYSLFNI